MLTLLIHSPSSPRKDMDVFLRPVIDELKDLWEQGIQKHDAMDNSVFNMRAAHMCTVNDFLARCSLFEWSGQGYKSCLTYNKDTSSIRIIGKEAYIGHRRFLPRSLLLRNNKKINGKIERHQLPRYLSIV